MLQVFLKYSIFIFFPNHFSLPFFYKKSTLLLSYYDCPTQFFGVNKMNKLSKPLNPEIHVPKAWIHQK